MKKGSKAKHCWKCKKIVAYEIPTGKEHYGIPEVTIKLKPDGIIVDKGMARYYYCKKCIKGK